MTRMVIEIEAGMVARPCNFTTWEAGARGGKQQLCKCVKGALLCC